MATYYLGYGNIEEDTRPILSPKPMPADSFISEFIHTEDELKYKAMNVIDQRKFFKELLTQKRIKLTPVYV